MELTRAFRITVRPKLLGADHRIVSLSLVSRYKEEGLEDIEVNGHLILTAPGDSRIPAEEGADYTLFRQKKELDRLINGRREHGEQIAADGFSLADYDELIELEQARYDYLKANPEMVREVMHVSALPIMIIKGRRPLRS